MAYVTDGLEEGFYRFSPRLRTALGHMRQILQSPGYESDICRVERTIPNLLCKRTGGHELLVPKNVYDQIKGGFVYKIEK